MPSELTRTERLTPLTARPSGELVTIDRAILAELAQRFAEAIGAVERANLRAEGVLRERGCLATIFATGSASADCGRSPSSRTP